MLPAPLLPFYILPEAVGLLLAVMLWRKHPSTSLLVGLGCAIGLLATTAWVVIEEYLHGKFFPGAFGIRVSVLLASICAHVVSGLLVVVGAFVGRGHQQPDGPPVDPRQGTRRGDEAPVTTFRGGRPQP